MTDCHLQLDDAVWSCLGQQMMRDDVSVHISITAPPQVVDATQVATTDVTSVTTFIKIVVAITDWPHPLLPPILSPLSDAAHCSIAC
jgi:hypothetical protein